MVEGGLWDQLGEHTVGVLRRQLVL